MALGVGPADSRVRRWVARLWRTNALCIAPTTTNGPALLQECDARPRKILHGAPVREAAETGAVAVASAANVLGANPLYCWLAQWIAHRLKGGLAAGPLSFSASSDVDTVFDAPVAVEQPKVEHKAKSRPQPSAPATKPIANPMLDFRLDVAAVMKAYRAKS